MGEGRGACLSRDRHRREIAQARLLPRGDEELLHERLLVVLGVEDRDLQLPPTRPDALHMRVQRLPFILVFNVTMI